ncbi:MAG: glycosyl hydrolase family 28 protein [Deltaproteobacteria bacterium]|nr:glycosyl hydrolase family 28 protein [Deltaproteobacteria bacterium]
MKALIGFLSLVVVACAGGSKELSVNRDASPEPRPSGVAGFSACERDDCGGATGSAGAGGETADMGAGGQAGAGGAGNVQGCCMDGGASLTIANAGPDQVVIDNDDDGFERIALSSAGSTGAVTYDWREHGVALASGANPTLNFRRGQHLVFLTVTDARGIAATDAVLVTIHDKAASERSAWNYPPAFGVASHPDYTVQVRRMGAGRPFETVFVHAMQVCKNRDGWDGSASTRGWIYDNTAVAMFDAPGPMEVRVTSRTSAPIKSVVLRPLNRNIAAAVSGAQVTFVIPGPTQLSLEINGEMYRNLNVIANPPETFVPTPGDPNVVWFGAGVHDIAGTTQTGILALEAGKTLYLAPGAFVRGAVSARNAKGAAIRGRGILTASAFADDSYQWAIEAWNSPGFLLEGILVTGSPDNTTVLSATLGLTVRNFKVISGRHWDDGVHINACKNVLVQDCYVRTADDAFVIYGANTVNYEPRDWRVAGVNQDSDNITVQNSVAWSDVAHPLMLGTHGLQPEGNVIENVVFRNIDALEHRQTPYQNGIYEGAVSVTCNDSNIVRNVLFEDIRIERMTSGQIFHIQTNGNTDYKGGVHGELVENITFRRVMWLGTSQQERPSALKAAGATHPVRNVTFDHCQRNGAWITDAASGNLAIGSHVGPIRYVYPGSP